MTTFGTIITILGAATIAANLMHLVDLIEQPRRHRRTA